MLWLLNLGFAGGGVVVIIPPPEPPPHIFTVEETICAQDRDGTRPAASVCPNPIGTGRCPVGTEHAHEWIDVVKIPVYIVGTKA